ncbi:MAG: hypothetical protein R3321_03815 [Nitrososphaeraceae archaeon]|nr:hypothetical protein [Nitrososphaeraceae archaeon]
MPRKSSSKTSEKEGIPQWVEDEIKSIELSEYETLNRVGYILEIYDKDKKLDIQLYEALPDGRTIVEGIDVPKFHDFSKFMKGFVYEFKIKMSKGKLSDKTREFLKMQYMLDMDYIFQFELVELQLMDVESEAISSDLNESDEE